MRVGLVVQRFGPDILGGSEFHAYTIARMLAPFVQLTVLTTCARDYRTWENVYPQGTSHLDGMEIIRFASEQPRDIAAFNDWSDAFFSKQTHSREEEEEYLKRQGPYVPELIRYLKTHGERFDAVIFYTYLYYPTAFGLPLVQDKAVLIPTFHLEPPAGLGIFKRVLPAAHSFIFNTPEEKAAFMDFYGMQACRHVVAALPIDQLVRAHTCDPVVDISPPKRYLLYCGRIDAGKGFFEVYDYIKKLRANGLLGKERFLVTGRGRTESLGSDVDYLGFVSEAAKYLLLRNALVTLVPSHYESLSIIALESLYLGTPIIGRASCLPVKGHITRGRCGALFNDFTSFRGSLVSLLADRRHRQVLGDRGRRYIDAFYSRDYLVAQYNRILGAFVSIIR